jgi:hypothetical protein
MGYSSIHSNQENVEPHKFIMVLLRQVRSLGRRSPSESPQMSTKPAKKLALKTTPRKTLSVTIPDPPFEMLWESHCDIPHVVTVEDLTEDEVSQVSLEKALKEKIISTRPLTPIPKSKSVFSRKLLIRTGSLSPPVTIAMSASEDEWPSDEEGEMTNKASSSIASKLKSQNPVTPKMRVPTDASPTLDFGGIFSPTSVKYQGVRYEENRHEQDDDTANLSSSSRDKSSSGSSFTPSSPTQEGALIHQEDGEQRDEAPDGFDPWPKYRLV